MMNLRKVANHPLLIRQHYDDAQLRVLAKLLKKADPSKELEYIIEDLSVLSDFEIHLECLKHRVILTVICTMYFTDSNAVLNNRSLLSNPNG